jgi:uncharacterized SAM-binding protein YcdF (DUF218 family)
MYIIIVLGTAQPKYESEARIELAFETYKKLHTEGHPVLMIVSGGNSKNRPLPESYLMKKKLMSLGVTESHIIEEPYSLNTIENILYSKSIISSLLESNYYCLYDLRPDLRPPCEDNDADFDISGPPLKLSKIVIVSSEYHLYRSSLIVKHFGMPVSVEYIGSKKYPLERKKNENVILMTIPQQLQQYKNFNPLDINERTDRLTGNKYASTDGIHTSYSPTFI